MGRGANVRSRVCTRGSTRPRAISIWSCRRFDANRPTKIQLAARRDVGGRNVAAETETLTPPAEHDDDDDDETNKPFSDGRRRPWQRASDKWITTGPCVSASSRVAVNVTSAYALIRSTSRQMAREVSSACMGLSLIYSSLFTRR